MPLIRLQPGSSQWPSIKHAAHILWRASTNPDINTLRTTLQTDVSDASLTAIDLYTGINLSRRAVLIHSGDTITLAFEGSDPNELIKNTWASAKGPNWWDLPYPVYVDGNRVHSFFRDMWHGMRDAAFQALGEAVQSILARGGAVKNIVVTGFSMGGGVSILAFTEILEHIRSTWGSESSASHDWAVDSHLNSLVQHLTFAAVAAADQGYYTVLNSLYERYQIRAWDFMNHKDWTAHTHDLAFRSWRGHRYILPDAVVRHLDAEFGPQGHFMLGYLKAAEWMEGNGTDQVKSAYSY
ncbi:hypothetical protein BKA63DRAFT_563987 [Paraphoma chrysanthemicola]|nr:hypothetical protein BKA63DRAFT_563987 [Paraphoma chrysanthemicola]